MRTKRRTAGLTLLLSLFFLSNSSLLGQTFSGIVRSKQSNEGLPFVSIGIKNTSRGTATDNSGLFTIEATLKDTLIFSSLGFKAIIVSISNLKSVIYLDEDVTVLNDVLVKKRGRLRTTNIGHTSGRSPFLMTGPNQFAKLLRNDLGTEGIIDQLIFNLNPTIEKDDRYEVAIKLRVYENENGLPGKDLLLENILIRVNKNKHHVVVDVSEKAIVFPLSGAFIGFDFIGFFDDGKFIPYSRLNRPTALRVEFVRSDTNDTYTRYFGSKWSIMKQRASENYSGMASKFGAKVSY